MSRLTLRLPETLHRQLEEQAKWEGVSLNQYLVYALARHVAAAYTVTPVPESIVRQQRETFADLLVGLGQISSAEAQRVLSEREPVEPEADLNPEMVDYLHQRMAE